MSNQSKNKPNNKPTLSINPVAGQTQGIVGKKTDIQNPDLWDFPMDYPMSIIGHEGKHEELLNEVKTILGTIFPDFDLASLQVRPSKTGRFHSIRCSLYLTHAEQVNTLYADLAKAETVRLVL